MNRFALILIIIVFFNSLFAQQNTQKNAKATYYSKKFDGRRTYSGEKFSSKKYTAAHRNFPLQSLVKVINPRNNKYVIVRINDRFRKVNFIDLTYAAAQKIDIIRAGVAAVKLELLDSSFYQEYMAQNQTEDSFLSFDLSNTLAIKDSVSVMDNSHKYYIRVASLKQKQNAQSFIRKNLPSKYRKLSSVAKSSYKRKALYKVLIGPFYSKEVADSNFIILKKRYKDATII